MKFRELPGISKIFLDLMEEAPALLSCVARHSGIDSLKASAKDLSARPFPREQFSRFMESQIPALSLGDAAARNIQRLGRPDSVIIWTSCRGDFAGGELFQFLNCLTAAGLASELERVGIPAVPVCRIDPVSPSGSRTLHLRMLDSESRLRTLASEEPAAEVSEAIEPIFRDFQSLGDAGQAAEPLALLRRSYAPGADLTQGTGRLLAALFEDWGLVVVDARDCELAGFVRRTSRLDSLGSAGLSTMLRHQEARLCQLGYENEESEKQAASDPSGSIVSVLMESILPVAARVVDQTNIRTLALLQPVVSELGLSAPKLWPRASATIIDARNRKILEKYGIRFRDLFEGSEGVLRSLALDGASEEPARRWLGLTSSIEACVSDLKALLPDGESLRDLVEDSRSRMLYQVGKLGERYTAATLTRRDVMRRQIGRACNNLAPEGCLQELKLAGLHFILRYSPLVLRTLLNRLENPSDEHQLIFLE